MNTLYELQAPTEWATSPGLWSSSSLDEVQGCPRRWQLLRSRWGAHPRFPVRPRPAAIEGQIIHDALDRLARACGQRGNPPFGSAEFKAAAAEAEFFEGFIKAITEWQEKMAEHPRPGPAFRLRTSPQELTNRAVRLFREQYQPGTGAGRLHAQPVTLEEGDLSARLRVCGGLTELRLQHPDLPFMGVIDRVQWTDDGVEVVDFKSGRPSERHREQLLRYAVLWWRAAGERPARITAQYLDGRATWALSEDEVFATERVLGESITTLAEQLIERPGPARPGTGCVWCPVRARCEAGWGVAEEVARSEERGDAELIVVSRPGPHGFLTHAKTGDEVAVVYEAALGALVPTVDVGAVLRVIDGVRKGHGRELEIKAWTEVFVARQGSRTAAAR